MNILEILREFCESKIQDDIFILSCYVDKEVRFSKKRMDIKSSSFKDILKSVARDILTWKKNVDFVIYTLDSIENLRKIFLKFKMIFIDSLKEVTYTNSNIFISYTDMEMIRKLVSLSIGNYRMGSLL